VSRPTPDPSPWGRLLRALLRRPRSSQAAAAVLCGLFAFALVTQAHTTSRSNGVSAARPDQLLAILADLQGRADRLRGQVSDLQLTERRLTDGSAGTGAAVAEARRRATTLGILTGTVAARGPGVVLVVDDPRGSVHADVLVDAIEELRDAGAEALQLSGVRVVASTAVVDSAGGLSVDGTRIEPPYRLAAIGDPHTLATALEIPGGVVDTVAGARGASAHVTSAPSITVTALRRLSAPRYARPAPTTSP
jgi:uncharacterized protein YlxW (UPF0749 family)